MFCCNIKVLSQCQCSVATVNYTENLMLSISKLKRNVPWWAKIAGKIVLKRLPLKGWMWQKIGLFVPGSMLKSDYAISVFQQHISHFDENSEGWYYLELGPGDSIATCVVAWSYGAAGGYLVDYGAYASCDMTVYYSLIKKIMLMNPKRDMSGLLDCKNNAELLEATNCVYMEHGLDDLKKIKSNSVDFVFSQAVLEHVRRSEFRTFCRELYRVQSSSGVGSHSIDFKDHLGGALNSLRFSHSLWEKEWFAFNSGFYTNRLRYTELVTMFEEMSFNVDTVEREMWEKVPLRRKQLNLEFASMQEDDLLIKGAKIIMRKIR